jgi:TetR/AcrR family transcriptional regulator, regulator of cefoperazone and chloramphenicol sensitivity
MTAKDSIFEAAMALLDEETNPDAITVRQIAERAGVGIGAINYHFQSKDNLLNQAVGALMQVEADKWLAPAADMPDDALGRLRALLTHTARLGLRYPHLLEIAVRYDLEQGDFAAARTIVPLLRELWAGERSEEEIRLAALQLLSSIQVLYLRREAVARFTGYRLETTEEVEQMVNHLIDNLLCLHKLGAESGAKTGDPK